MATKEKQKPNKLAKLQSDFDNFKEMELNNIKKEPNKWKRFWKWVWFILIYPFRWIWVNMRDVKTLIIFLIVFLIVSSEVWIMYLIYFITGNDWYLGIGSACWLFWLGPGTPFWTLCIGITIGVKALLNKWRVKKYGRRKDRIGKRH